MTEFIAVPDQRHPESKSRKSSEESDDRSLAKKNPDDLRDVRPERFNNSDLAPLLHCHCDQRAHDPERCDDHDKEQKEKHHCALEPHGLKVLTVHVDPSLRVFRRLEKLLNRLFYPLGTVRVVGPNRYAVQRVTQAV